MAVTTKEGREKLRQRLGNVAGFMWPKEWSEGERANTFDYIYRSRIHKIASHLEQVHADGRRGELWEERYAQDVFYLLLEIEELRETLLEVWKLSHTYNPDEYEHTLHVDIPVAIEEALANTAPKEREPIPGWSGDYGGPGCDAVDR